MAVPEYDYNTLPAIEHPFTSSQEVTKRYLGGRAVTGQEYAVINFFSENNAQIKALYEFWRDDCNSGLTQFLAPIPVNGSEVSRYVPTALCEFIEEISMEKLGVHWKQGIKVKIIEYKEVLGIIVDDAGNLMVDDVGNVLISISENAISNSNKEITYG